MRLYLAVTPDEFEFPIFIEDSVKELADKLGMNARAVSLSICRGYTGRNTGVKLVRVIIEED